MEHLTSTNSNDPDHHSSPVELQCDAARTNPNHADATGIYVRAKRANKWASVDIAELDYVSLMRWLRSRGGENLWAETTVAILLGHGQGKEEAK